MSINQIIKEAMEKNPLALKKTLEEELRKRVGLALEEKMKAESDCDDDDDDDDEDDLDEAEDEAEEDTTPKKGKMPPQFMPGYKKKK